MYSPQMDCTQLQGGIVIKRVRFEHLPIRSLDAYDPLHKIGNDGFPPQQMAVKYHKGTLL